MDFNILKFNFQDHYGIIRYDYSTKTNCREHGCAKEGICRCSTIYNQRLTSLNIEPLVYHIYDRDSYSKSSRRETAINSVLFGVDETIDIYTIDRVLRCNKIYEFGNWDIKITYGYYGEEIDEIVILDDISKKVINELEIAFSIDELNGRIEYLLGLEYGRLLPELEHCQYEVIEIPKNDIIFANSNHFNSLKKEEYYSDGNYSGIRGIVIEKNGKYRLIDGYHRVFSTNNELVKVLRAFK